MNYSVKLFAPKPFKRHSTIPNLKTYFRHVPGIPSEMAKKKRQNYSTESMVFQGNDSILSYSTFESDLDNENAFNEIISILNRNRVEPKHQREVVRSSNPIPQNYEIKDNREH